MGRYSDSARHPLTLQDSAWQSVDEVFGQSLGPIGPLLQNQVKRTGSGSRTDSRPPTPVGSWVTGSSLTFRPRLASCSATDEPVATPFPGPREAFSVPPSLRPTDRSRAAGLLGTVFQELGTGRLGG